MSTFELIKVVFVALLGIYGFSSLFQYLFPSTSHKITESCLSLWNKLFNASTHNKKDIGLVEGTYGSWFTSPNKQSVKPNRRIDQSTRKSTSETKEPKLSREDILRRQRRRLAEKQKAIEERERKQKEWKRKKAEETERKRIERERQEWSEILEETQKNHTASDPNKSKNESSKKREKQPIHSTETVPKQKSTNLSQPFSEEIAKTDTNQNKKPSVRPTKKEESNSKNNTRKTRDDKRQGDTFKSSLPQKIHSRIEVEERLYWPYSQFNDVINSVPSTTQNTRKPKKVRAEKKELNNATARPRKNDYIIDQTVPAHSSFDDKLLFVNYDAPQKFIQADSWSYAVAKFPEYGCVMKPPAEAKFEHRGTKEESFEKYISKNLSSELTISGSYALPTGNNTRPFEPDIAILYKDDNTNFFIDIEIDEPYGGISRSAIHHIGDTDDARDLYFIHRGWIVIRFAEIQVQKEPMKCAAYIAKIIHELAPNISFDSSLLNSSDPTDIERWSRIQAEKWAKEDYREKYLGIGGFKIRDQGEIISSIEDRDIDREVEGRVKSQPNYSEDTGPGVNRLNHPKDKRIRFDPIPHQYYIDGVPVKSVTSVVDQYFPTFDSDSAAEKYLRKRGLPLSDKYDLIKGWEKKGETARTQGTKLHLFVEKYFAGNSLSQESDLSKEIEQFKMFLDDHDHIDPVRTEWRIFDERIRIAGTIDFLSKNSDGTFDIYDWKRSKKLVDSKGIIQNTNPYQSGFGRLSFLDDTSFNRYSLQQGIYKYILESRYGIKIQNMHLIVMHPRYDSYHKLEVDFMEKPIRYILGFVK